jgi:phenylacetic acid degradation operon negative regulatory protein
MREVDRLKKKYSSTTHYVLSSIIPYTEANLKLAFKPNLFFSDLEKLDKIKKEKLRSAYYRAIKQGLLELDDQAIPRLTHKGRKKLRPFRPKKLKDAQLMVVFDIPEAERWKRYRLRLLLRELSFKQVQKSVWVSDKDCKDYLEAEINEYQLKDCVELFEAKQIKFTMS